MAGELRKQVGARVDELAQGLGHGTSSCDPDSLIFRSNPWVRPGQPRCVRKARTQLQCCPCWCTGRAR